MMDLLSDHLEHSIWTPELEHALERFSLPTYLNWFDYNYTADDEHYWWVGHFPEKFLSYLEGKVSIPAIKIQLLMVIRENLTFITTIACVIWSMLCLPSTVPP